MQRDSELIGRLYYKEGHDLYHWRLGWFVLDGSALHFSSGDNEEEEEVLQLKQLQELSKDRFVWCSLHSIVRFNKEYKSRVLNVFSVEKGFQL